MSTGTCIVVEAGVGGGLIHTGPRRAGIRGLTDRNTKQFSLYLKRGLSGLHARVAIEVMVVAQSGSTFLALKVLLKRRGLTHRGGGYYKVVLLNNPIEN